jgi:carbamoyl-phosphate synthase small subunit
MYSDTTLSSMIPSRLILENGLAFHGLSPTWQKKTCFGEVVFTTGMTGYPESLTDPSYKGQILTFTYPLIGNYGIPASGSWESKEISVSGVVINTACTYWSHYTGISSLLEWLKSQNVPIITGVDTRELTKHLRSSGTMLGAITTELENPKEYFDPNQEHLVSKVSTTSNKIYGQEEKTVIVVDCGIKENIIRSLCKLPIKILQVPYDYDYSEENYAGVFISNGPGDPVQCSKTISILQKALKNDKPIFGICLGTQLLALAAGAKTYKLPFGHRGQNQPCIDTKTNQCYITSQNHGYAVDESSLSPEWYVSYRNLNDGSVEGISHHTKPFFAVQFHPEASPGPTDTLWLFEQFSRLL